MFRIRTLALPGVALALTASCSSSSTSPPSAPPPVGPGAQPTPPQTSLDQSAVALGVAIDARDDAGAPRLVRAIVPRAGAAGMTAEDAARDHVAALTPLWLSNRRAADLAVQGVQKLRNGASIIRFQQQIDGIDIRQSELHVMVQRDGSLAAISGTVRPSGGRTAFRSTPAAAVDHALDALYGASRTRPAVTETGERAGYRELTVAPSPEFAVQMVRAKPELMPEGNQTTLSWVIEIFTDKLTQAGKREPAARRFVISDADGSVLRNVNLTANDSFVYRVLAETTGNRTPLDGPLLSFTPHPTGTPDGSLPDFGPYNLVVQEAFNGPHDPWLGTMATTTSGNNVEAYADINPPQGFGPGDIRPEVRAGRTLNYRYDFTAEPLATPDQSKAAAVNVFFVTNWLHDWYYDSGFTEVTGNAQLDNLGRGGVGGDPLVAHAQDDALGGSRDNANMTTPADGVSPFMNMFLWSGATDAKVTTATATPTAATFLNGPHSFDVTGQVVLAVDTVGGTHSACGPVTAAVAGKIAFVEYQFACASDTVVDNVKAAGAIGVIAQIAFPGFPAFTLTESPTANFPGLVLSFDDGAALEATLPATATLHLSTTTEHDGDFDNAIISHEWGHYLHHRLASCEVTQQCNSMSEGWGDFNALMMMLRPTDNRDGTFGTGLYALTAGGFASFGFQDPGYFGIRRFPYSTNRAKNPLSLRHIGEDNPLPPEVATNPGPVGNGNSELHNAGEVWAESLWEVYNVLIDEHGLVEAHRRMTDYVVAGLLLTPAEATYVEGRDAILAAAGAIDTDDMILMAAAFAGRGSGTCAVAPRNTTFDLTGVVESGTIAAKLATSIATVSDDGVSCDHDGYLDPGESGTIHITVANNGVIAAEDMVATATTTTPGVTFGKPVQVGVIAALSQVDIAIPVKLAATAAVNANLDISISIDGSAGCGTGHMPVALHERMGVDEVPAAATIDTVETKTIAWTLTGDFAEDFWHRAPGLGANHVLFGTDAPFPTDTQLVSPVLQVSPTAPLVVTFKHAFDLETASVFGPFFDGSVIEISNDGGASWRDVTAVGADPMYPAVINPDPTNPLQNRPAFSGASPAFPALSPVTLNFGTQFAGQPVQIRFRLVSDFCCNATGWAIDDIAVSGITNTPFPALVAEPTRCTGRSTDREPADSAVIAVRTMPRNSLAGFPAVEAQ